jgi:hypothetical protein
MTITSANDYISQVRSRTETAARKFRDGVRALHSTQAANGMLRSGATISKTLRLFEEEFDALTDSILGYLGKAIVRTNLGRDELLGLTAQLLSESLAAYKSIVDREKLLSFAPGKSIGRVIDGAFARADQRLTLRLQEFRHGLDDAAPSVRGIAPASDRYVSLVDNQRREFTDDLAILKEEARGANDVEEENREIALSEIAAFEATIVQQRVSTDLVQRFVDRVLKWMMTIFTGAVFAEVAQRLIQALAPLIAVG